MVRGLPRAEIAPKVERALAMVRLEGLADRRPQQLSGGQQQRVAVARALVFEPQLVLMDEPLGALDKQLREQMQFEIKHLHERLGVTMVYVTHDQGEALTMSDRIAVFNAGRSARSPSRAGSTRSPTRCSSRSSSARTTSLRRHGARSAWRPVQRRAARRRTGRGHRDGACRRRRARSISRSGRRRWRWARRPRAASIAFPPRCSRSPSSATSCACGWRRWAREDFIVKLANAPGQAALEPGGTVEIGWRAEDCRALGE